MAHKRIRPISIGIFIHQGRILLLRGYDRVKDQYFFRPLGGGIEFGEAGAEALHREMQEELGAETQVRRLLGTLEDIFTFEGEPGPELIMIFEAEFIDAAYYDGEIIAGCEGEDLPFTAEWVSVEEAVSGLIPLYPDGLERLLRQYQMI
jgi:ADP-ribose pyrophosphatase YjhB (NUDIX family)